MRPSRSTTAQHASVVLAVALIGLVAYLLLANLRGQLGQVAVLVAVWTVAITGLNMVQGLAGYPSLAQASFYGAGAYVSTILLHRGVPMVLAGIVAVLVAAVAGLLVGLIFSRTRGQYFAIGTLFFAAVVTLVLNNEIRLTGGPNGLPVDLGFSPVVSLQLLAASMSVGFAIFYFLRRSRLGLRLLSIREDEDLAAHLGVPTARTKLIALTLSAIFGAWAGVLFAQYNGVISPPQFTYGQGFLMFVAIGIGGYGRLLSPLVGSLIVLGVPQLLNLGPGVSQIVVGVIFVVVMLLVPVGIIGALDTGLHRLLARRRTAAEGEQA
ncbi:MAG: branched-chain amino acid ABC transporter permease [Chloroflexi bacterium]|nr:branched-chain amino acid ABC transporter permease [Chloroflexota bacterium]